jgi:cell division transport system ATP-binding protein
VRATTLDIMRLLEKINSLGTTVLVITHEKELVNKFEKRVVVIDNGVLVSDRTGGYYSDETLL